MTDIKNLRTIVQAWADKVARDYGTSVRWVDLYAQNSAMEQYRQYRLTITTENARILPVPAQPKDVIRFEDERSNNTSTETISTFTFSEETTSTFSWSLSEGIDVGTQLGISAPTPVGFITGQTNVNISLSSTQQWEDTTTRFWDRQEQVTVQPRTRIVAAMEISTFQYDATFEADTTLSGWVAVWFNDKIDLNARNGDDRHWLWFPTIDTVFRDQPVSGFTILGGGLVNFLATGLFKGVQGTKCVIKYDEYPIGEPPDGGSTADAPILKAWTEVVDGFVTVPASDANRSAS